MKFRKKGPWDDQKELQRYYKDEVPDLVELDRIISSIYIGSIDRKYQTLRARALFTLYYLTACRCRELLKILTKPRRKIVKDQLIVKQTIRYEGIKLEDIKTKTIKGKRYLKITSYNLKNKKRIRKTIVTPIEKEKLLIKHLSKFVKFIKENPKYKDKPLFPFTQQRAIQIIKGNVIINNIPMNLHFIRHIRATHLVTLYNFSDQLLVRFMGWTDSRPAKHYIELRMTDIAQGFQNG